jgi:5'-3' exonuclease
MLRFEALLARRDYFPNYKRNRKKTRDDSNLNWDAIFECLNTIKAELKEFFPYKFLEVYGAEADDIIAALCGELEFDNGKTLILSGDKDFIQLQKFKNVTQYSPITKKYVNGVDPEEYLKEHVMKGDSSDGVPNVLSPDNTFVDGIRQKPLSKKKITSFIDGDLPNDEVKRNFQRNETLIDLTKSPDELFIKILEEFRDAPEGDRSKLLNYFTQKRLRNLVESIGEF